MGIRRARIADVGRRTIDVRGRDRYGERIYVTFGRQPSCPSSADGKTPGAHRAGRL